MNCLCVSCYIFHLCTSQTVVIIIIVVVCYTMNRTDRMNERAAITITIKPKIRRKPSHRTTFITFISVFINNLYDRMTLNTMTITRIFVMCGCGIWMYVVCLLYWLKRQYDRPSNKWQWQQQRRRRPKMVKSQLQWMMS